MKKYIKIKNMKYMLLGLIAHSMFASAATIPQAGSNPIVINQTAITDNITYLMASAASRPDTTSVNRPEAAFRPKHFWLESISSSESIEWRVRTQVAESFRVTTMVNAAANQSFRLEVVGNNSRLDYTLDAGGWTRDDSGTIFIPAGTNTLRLTRTSNSGDIHLKSLELLAVSDEADYLRRVENFKGNPNTFRNYDYGVMFQYGAWGYPRSGPAKSNDQQAHDFNVPAFVQKVKSTGAEYIIWSTSWWTFEFNAPSAAVDSQSGTDRTSIRDLIGELATAFENEGLDFFLYYHTGQDSHLGYDSTDFWRNQNFPDGFTQTGTGDRTEFFNNWKSIVSEMGNRYGTKLDGWFFDDGLVYYPAPFEALGAAAKAGNPDRLISYNPWIIAHYTDFEDLSFGEECKAHGSPVGGNGLLTSSGDAGTWGHCMHRMEEDWGITRQNQNINNLNFSVASAIAEVEDNSSRGAPTSFNLMMWEDGQVAQRSMDVMLGLNEAIHGQSGNGGASGELISQGRPATQTSTGHGGVASRAVDGSTNGAFHNGSVTHSAANVFQPEWRVDLGSDTAIGQIDVYNRTDCCTSRLSNFKVSVIDSSNREVYVSEHSGAPSPLLTVNAQGAVGRYVRVQLLGTGTLSLAEVQVYSASSGGGNGELLSQGRPATQSNTSQGGVASRAVDGNTDGTFHNGSVTHSAANAFQPEWRVDLGSDTAIGQIDVYNRTDCCSSRLSNFKVSVIDSSNREVFNSEHGSAPNPKLTVNAQGAVGRYVRVQLLGTGVLSLAEVQVYAPGSSGGGSTTLISQGKPATQTSTAHSGVASRAVDGNTNGVYGNGSVTHSAENASYPEWRVDLGSDTAIGKIDVFNRTDCCTDRLSNYKVSIVDSRNREVWKSEHGNSPGSMISLDARGAIGRYVRVTILGTGTLSLAEVQVYSN